MSSPDLCLITNIAVQVYVAIITFKCQFKEVIKGMHYNLDEATLPILLFDHQNTFN